MPPLSVTQIPPTSYSEDSCDEEGNFSAFMTIAHVESMEDLNLLVQELGEYSDEE